MRAILLLLFGIIFNSSVFAQGKFERRIIIKDSIFYAIEIKDQVGILWTGKTNLPIDSAEKYALPAGTKRRSLNFLPLAWDIRHDSIFAINYTEFAQNERLKSLKSIPISKLEKYNGDHSKQLMQAAFENAPIENWPLVKTLKKYKYIDDLYFDILVTDTSIYEFIIVAGEFSVWNYSGGEWAQSRLLPFYTEKYFVAYSNDRKIYLMNSRGEKFGYDEGTERVTSKLFDLESSLLVDDRDDHAIYFVKSNAFENTQMSIEHIIANYKVIN